MSTTIKYGVGFLKNTPHTSNKAIVCDWHTVNNVRVINLKNAFYRGATFSGTFELSDKENPFFESDEGLRVEIKLYWYGRRLKTRWARVLISGKRPKIILKEECEVGKNLGER